VKAGDINQTSKPTMKVALQIQVFAVAACFVISCAPKSSDAQFVKQKVPVEIQSDKPVTVEIDPLSGSDRNEVGIRCSPEVWNVLNSRTKQVEVRLKSSSVTGVEITNVSPSAGAMWPIKAFYHLFTIYGPRGSKATVEITFPNAPAGMTAAEILVLKTPEDTEAPF